MPAPRPSQLALATLAVAGGLALALVASPQPCAACSPPEPVPETVRLELQEVAVDGNAVTPDPAYARNPVTLVARPGGLTMRISGDSNRALELDLAGTP